MKALFFALWGLLYVISATIALLPAIRKRKKVEGKAAFLSFKERKICVCSLTSLILTGAHVATWLAVFKENPNAAINAILIKHYLKFLLLSIAWPPHFFVISADIVIVLFSYKRDREHDCIKPRQSFNKRTDIFVGVAFLFFLCASIALYCLSIINTFFFSSLLLMGLIAVLTLWILNRSGDGEVGHMCGTGDGSVSQSDR